MAFLKCLVMVLYCLSIKTAIAQKQDFYHVQNDKLMFGRMVAGMVDNTSFQIHENTAYLTICSDNDPELIPWTIYHAGYRLWRPFNDIIYDPVAQGFRMTGAYHAKDKDHIFYMIYVNEGHPHGPAAYYTRFEVMEAADPDSFRFFGPDERYGRDKDHAYFEYKMITEADSGTFEVLSNSTAGDIYVLKLWSGEKINRPVSPGVAKDKDHVFWKDRIIVSADPDDFELTAPESCKIGGRSYKIISYKELQLIEP